MSNVILFANVGNRDVQHCDLSKLPQDGVDRQALIPRVAGAFLREHLDDHLAAIQLPMMDKALQHIAPDDSTAKNTLYVKLFATDQAHATERFRQSDTVEFAAIIQQILARRYGWTPKEAKMHVQVITIPDAPADYDQMLDFYREALPKQQKYITPDDAVWLLIAGGTPAMTTMLMFVGAELFGLQAELLYIAPDKAMALPLDTIRQIALQTLRTNVTELVTAHAYPMATLLLERDKRVQLPDAQHTMLLALLKHATARSNLDLAAARDELTRVHARARGLRNNISLLLNSIARSDDATYLAETVHVARLAASTETWLDFVNRLYRFAEGCMHVAAEQVGAQWEDKKRDQFDAYWWQQHAPSLPSAVDTTGRQVDRTRLRAVIATLGKDHYQHLLTALATVEKPLPLRNRAVHDFHPLTRAAVEQHATIADVLTAMATAYTALFARELSPYPYAVVNELCRRTLAGEL